MDDRPKVPLARHENIRTGGSEEARRALDIRSGYARPRIASVEPYPYSSVVGTGLLLKNDRGAVIGQLSLINVQGGQEQAEMIAGQAAAAMRHGLNGEGVGPAPSALLRDQIKAAREAERQTGAFGIPAGHWKAGLGFVIAFWVLLIAFFWATSV